MEEKREMNVAVTDEEEYVTAVADVAVGGVDMDVEVVVVAVVIVVVKVGNVVTDAEL